MKSFRSFFTAKTIQKALHASAPTVPGCRPGAHGGHGCVHIPARESGTHPGQIDPIGFAEPLEETPSYRSRPPPEYPSGRKVDNVQGVVGAEQYIAVVEVGQSHSAAVQLIENHAESIEECVVEPGSSAFPQWFGVNPSSNQSVGSKTTEKRRQAVDGPGRLVSRRFSANQPTTEAVANHGTSRLIGLDRHPLAILLIEENISLRSVASNDPANWIGSRDGARVEGPSTSRV